MHIRRIISRRIRRDQDGVQLAGDVNAVISANVGGRGSSTHVSSKQSARAEQRSEDRKSHDKPEGQSNG